MILRNSNRFLLGRFECKCCDSHFATSKGVKQVRRRTRRVENRQWKKDML